MPRYDAFTAQTPTLSPTRGWMISALTGSLVVHVGLFVFFHFQKLENFALAPEDQPDKKEILQRVRLLEDKKKKPEELRTTLPEKKSEPRKELSLPKEVPRPEEISVSSQHKQLDSTKLFANEKPVIEMAKMDTTPKVNPDDLAPRLDDSFFADRKGPKVTARMATTGPDGDGTAQAIQVAGQDVEGILNGLTSGTGTSRRLSLPGNLTFGYDSSDISVDGRGEMEKIAEAFRKFLGEDLMKSTFIIEGHTDPTGTPEYNQRLSERRAESVRAWLVANLNLPPDSVKTVGYGATRPAPDVPLQGTPEELQGHRRTEIIVRRAKTQ